MNRNEIRIVKISGGAIDELVWELLNKSGEQFLDLPENSETIFHLNWDKGKDELVFYALEFENPHNVNFEAIDRYISKHIGITTDSLFDPDREPFMTFSLDEAIT